MLSIMTLMTIFSYSLTGHRVMGQTPLAHRSCSNVIGPNLIFNPEFNLGNAGISSSYLFQPDFICDWGEYSINRTVRYDPAAGCYGNPTFDIRTIWAATDRNLNGGRFMLIDPCNPNIGGAACQALDANSILWSQTVNICPSTDYLFAIYAKNLYYTEGPQFPGAAIQPQFDLYVNGEKVRDYHVEGVAVEDTTFSMPQTSIEDSAIWRQVSGVWSSNLADSVAVLEIRNTQTTTGGNDLAIDGLFFGLCGRDVRILSDAVVPQCTNDNNISPLTLVPSVETQNSDWGYYEWYKNDSVVESDVLLLPTDPIPNLITPANPVTNDYYGNYRLVVYPGNDPNVSCGTSSERIAIVDSCGPTSFPVEWLQFEAMPLNGAVTLHWSTATESQNRGFAIEVSQLGQAFEHIGWVDGSGDSRQVQAYQFQTEAFTPGNYVFRLRQVDFDGQSQFSPRIEARIDAKPQPVRISPNPTDHITEVTVSPSIDQSVRIDLYTLTGQRVRTVYQGLVQAHAPLTLSLDLSDLGKGVYLLDIRGSHFQAQRRLMLR
jgi:hypothetical protein